MKYDLRIRINTKKDKKLLFRKVIENIINEPDLHNYLEQYRNCADLLNFDITFIITCH